MTVSALAASLLVNGGSLPVQAAGQNSAAAPSKEELAVFPRPEDPNAPLRSGLAEAKKLNTPVEVEEAGTESSRTWAYPDGHLTTETYSGPARIKHKDGSWAWLDTSLVEQNGVLRPKVAKADLEISTGGTERTFAEVRSDKGRSFGLSWRKDLPRPNVTGNVATYPDAAGPGADLVVTALPSGFQHDVVLRDRPKGPVEYRIPVETKGVRFGLSKKKGLQLSDTKGKTLAEAPQPVMWDSSLSLKEIATTGAGTPRRIGKIDFKVVTENGEQVLILKPDAAFLADPATKYPVTVDPTTSLTLQTDTTLNSWAYLGTWDKPYEQNLNVGTESSVIATGPPPLYTQTFQQNYKSAFLKFDATPLNGKAVIDAKLVMHADDTVGCKWYEPKTFTATRVTSAWTPGDITWTTQPSVTSIDQQQSNQCPEDGLLPWNGIWTITDMAKAWAAGAPNHGIRVTGTAQPYGTDKNYYYIAPFHSMDRTGAGSTPPKLTVSYVLPPEFPTVTAESIDSMTGGDAIARSDNIKVSYSSRTVENSKINYSVSINDATMGFPTGVPAGEAAWWKFDEPATAAAIADSSSKNKTATQYGTPGRSIGQLGRAFVLPNAPADAAPPPVPIATPPAPTPTTTCSTWCSPHGLAAQPRSQEQAQTVPSPTGSQQRPLSPPASITRYAAPVAETWTYAATDGSVIDTSASFSAGVWVKLDHTRFDQAVLSQSGTNQSGFRLMYLSSSNKWALVVPKADTSGAATLRALSTAAAQTGVWTHLVVVHDAAAKKIRLYVNGTLAQETAHTTPWNAQGAFQIGRARIDGTDTAYLGGSVDDLHVYPRAITATEAAALRSTATTTTDSQIPSGQAVSRTFSVGNPDSFKFVVTACRADVSPGPCSQSPAYRITSDAAMLPSGLETGMADPAQPILSGMANRPSGGPVTAKFYLYDSTGAPVGTAPLGTRTVNGGTRASLQVPANTVDAGRTYTWQMAACAVSRSDTPAPDPVPTPAPTTTPTPTPTPSTTLAPNQNLVAAYGMNEGTGTTVADASGKNNPGTARDTTWTDGKYGKALSFNGTSSWVTVNHSSSLRLTGGMTLSAWVKPTTTAGWRTVAMKDHASGSAYGLYASNGSVPSAWLLKPDASGHNTLDGTTGLVNGRWDHVAVTYDGTMARLYVDGQEVSTSSWSGNLVNDNGALHIGGNSKWGEYFSGLIDEVRIYKTAQSQAQIQLDMNTPVDAPVPTPSPTASPTSTPTVPATSGDPTEICTSKTAPISFTTPGTPTSRPEETVRNLTLSKENFIIKTVKTSATACNGDPCTVIDSTVAHVGGSGAEKQATVIGFKLNELPNGAAISESILKLGSPICSAGSCVADTVITARPLKNPVTVDTRGSDLEGDVDTTIYSLPLNTPQADITGSEYSWLLLTSSKDEVITFGDEASAEQPSLVLTYIPAGPPSKVLNLTVQPGDGGVAASWGLPELTGSMALLDGYDIEIDDSNGTTIKTFNVKDPLTSVSELTNGSFYILKVRAKTAFGVSEWESTSFTPRPLEPPPAWPIDQAASCTTGTYKSSIENYYKAQDAVLEGSAPNVWEAPGITSNGPVTASLSLENSALLAEKRNMQERAVKRTDSEVTLDDVVAYQVPNGEVHVRTTVDRAWNESPIQSANRLAGQVEPHKSKTSVIHAFTACGGRTAILSPGDLDEDSTDFSYDPESPGSCGDLGGMIEGHSITAGKTSCTESNSKSCKTPERDGNGYSVLAHADSTIKVDKNWRVHAEMCSQWRVAWGTATTTTNEWTVIKHINYIRLYPMDGKWTTAESKYRQKNALMVSTGRACFRNENYNPQIGLSVDFKNGDLSLEGAITGSAKTECQPYTEEFTSPRNPNSGDAPPRPTIWNKFPEITARCESNVFQWCELSGYRHEMTADVDFWYHENGIPKKNKIRKLLECGLFKLDGSRF
ncbi:LamG-like jellyroll fold domain-containing protein [Streptosporangium saharense]|uniref:LamG-like jellyroll fold domain-containing protein n=1 Tax=Streptosporangium saharense TaxID=1706840 RepID=UPI00369957E8